MTFCWSSFVSGGYNDNTKISKFLRNGASEERLFYDFKNHYLCFSPSLTPTIEAILRGSHGEIFTKKKIMRRATYAVVKLKRQKGEEGLVIRLIILKTITIILIIYHH